jgi:hypothetical protein
MFSPPVDAAACTACQVQDVHLLVAVDIVVGGVLQTAVVMEASYLALWWSYQQPKCYGSGILWVC